MPLIFEKQNLRLWCSQRIAQHQFSTPMRGFCLSIFAALSLILIPISANAQITANNQAAPNRQQTDQIPQPSTFFNPPIPPFVPETSVWSLIGQNLHGGYSVSYMGPRLSGGSLETYNIYLADVAPVQLFHGADLRYKVNDDLELGFKGSAVQNIADGVVGNTGIVYQHNFIMYDPSVFFNLPNLITVPDWSVFTSASFSLSVTQASMDVGKITSVDVSQSWNLNTLPQNWSFGVNLDFNPKFYTEPKPNAYKDRQTFFFSVGHYLGYRVAPEFAIQTSTNFDWDHRAPDPNGSLHFTNNLPDTFRFSFSITPIFPRLFVSFGGYFQFIIWNPDSATSIVGADFSIGF